MKLRTMAPWALALVLAAPAALAQEQGTQEAMGAVEHRKPQRHRSAEDPHRTAGVPDRLAEHPVPRPVGPSADHPLRPDIPALRPPAQRDIVAGQDLVSDGDTVDPVEADPETLKKLVGEVAANSLR